MIEHMLWVEKYRPRKVEDTILPTKLKSMFIAMVKQGQIPTLLLTGKPGVGKTTVARALLDELGYDYIIINGSLEGNIDTLRSDIKNFASTVSMSGGRKYVIIDEADFLNPNSFQPALRNFLEQFSKNCGFILTCNYPNRILKEIKSRCSEVEFTIPEKERDGIAAQYLKKACLILDKENVEYEKKVVAQVIMNHFPDFRRILGELQQYSLIGKIDTGILHNAANVSIEELLTHMKAKNYSNVRRWVGENQHIPPNELFRRFYDLASKVVTPASIPLLVLLLAKYQYQAAFVLDQEINTAACLAEMMVDVEFA
jgi:DNA polymerase III delta prime subunit